MKIVFRPFNHNKWAKVAKYKNCHEDLRPYFMRNGLRYTGFETEEDQKKLKEIEDKIGTDLSKQSEFWDTFFIRVTDDDIILDLEDFRDLINYYFLKGHRRVTTSLAEPMAGMIGTLINEEDEADKENVEFELEQEVMTFLGKMSEAKMRDALRLYGINGDIVKGSVAKNKLIKLVKQDPGKFKRLWIDNDHRDTYALIDRAISAGVIKLSGRRYIFGEKDLGFGLEETAMEIDDPKNNDVKISIKKQVEK